MHVFKKEKRKKKKEKREREGDVPHGNEEDGPCESNFFLKILML